MLLKHVETLQNTLTKQTSIDFCFVLYNFYVVKGNKKKHERIAFDAFRYIKRQSNDRSDNGFWVDGSALLFALENLDKNGFIEADLDTVLQDYNIWLVGYLSKQCTTFKQDDLPFYVHLLFDRLRHQGFHEVPMNKVLITQIAEKIVQYMDNPTVSLHQVAIHRHIAILLRFRKTTLYRTIIEQALRRLAARLEEDYTEENNSSFFLNNLTVYPTICQLYHMKPRLDLVAIIDQWFRYRNLADKTLQWTDKYFLLNALIRINRELANHIWDEALEDILSKEVQVVFSQDVQQKYLLALTINSYLHPNLSSWDEVLLVPRFSFL